MLFSFPVFVIALSRGYIPVRLLSSWSSRIKSGSKPNRSPVPGPTAERLAIIFWSFASAAHALAGSAFGFGVARFFLGLGEAGNFPAAIKTVAEWFPIRERAFGMAIFNSGAAIGSVVAPPLIVWLSLTYGWRTTFIVTGSLGFVRE